MYAVYLKHIYKNKQYESVLLIDGAYTAEHNCFNRHRNPNRNRDGTYGYLAMVPRLFHRKCDAQAFSRRFGFTGPRYVIHEYKGPADPREGNTP